MTRVGLLEEFCNKIEKGLPFWTAAALCDVSERVAFNWKAKGEAAMARADQGQDAQEGDALYTNFVQSVRKAEAKAIERNSDILQLAQANGSGVNWLPAAWMLERRWADHYAKRDPSAKPEDSRPIQINFTTVEGVPIAPRRTETAP